MIALIALFALAIMAGLVIGILAIVVALIKVILRGIRGRHATEPLGTAGIPDAESCTPQRAIDQEFLRLMTTEWSGTVEADES